MAVPPLTGSLSFASVRLAIIPIVAAAGILLSVVGRAAEKPPAREPGAIYLADFSPRPCRLRVLADAPLSARLRDPALLPARLPRGQTVDLLAVAANDNLLQVRGASSQGSTTLRGWVSSRHLSAPGGDLLAALRQRGKRRQQVIALGLQGKIAVNMTHREVELILGAPLEKSPGKEGGKPSAIWEYPWFLGLPRQTGPAGDRPATNTSGRGYISRFTTDRVQVGTVEVTFTLGLVSDIERKNVNGWVERSTSDYPVVGLPAAIPL